MKKNLKLLYTFLVILFVFGGAFFASKNVTLADDCDPEVEICSCSNGGTPPECGCPEDEWQGSCVSYCPAGTSRNSNGECEIDSCENGASNPPECNECGGDSEMCGGSCVSACGENQERNSDCSCTDLECQPPKAGDYPECPYCASGYEMCDGVCFQNCPSGQYRSTDTSCECVPSGNGCCSDENALNYDSSCPDSTATPPTQSDPGTCTYCDSSSTDPECVVNHCNNVQADNYESEEDCEDANPNMNCVANSFTCTFPTLYYCDDPNADFPPSITAAECDQNKVDPQQQCVADQAYCYYPTEYYCDDPRAGNYDENGDDCQAANPYGTCEPGGSCAYEYCNQAFLLDVDCSSGYSLSDIAGSYSYQYSSHDPYNETCDPPTALEIAYLENYFEAEICEETTPPVCTGPFCNQIDWCPADEGVQTSPQQCTDICPNIDGVQLSGTQCGETDICYNLPGVQTTIPIGYGLQGNNCVPQTDGMCGTLHNGSASSASVITGTNACVSGTRSAITYNNGEFNWQCLGVQGGLNDSCDAAISCGSGTYYCEQSASCKPLNETCGPPNTCVNQNLCVFNGNVSLGDKLKVTPLVERYGTCVIDIGASAGVFNSFSTTTHCVLTNQDSIISTFDPVNLTTSGSTIFNQTNVQKDTNYELKCYNGAFTGVYEDTAYGSCRLNLNTKEFN